MKKNIIKACIEPSIITKVITYFILFQQIIFQLFKYQGPTKNAHEEYEKNNK